MRHETVTFTSTSSANPDRSLTQTLWDLDGDGAFDDASGQEVSRTFSTSGIKTVRLQVTDSEGATATKERSVTVTTQSLPPLSTNVSTTLQGGAGHTGYLPGPSPSPPLHEQWTRRIGFGWSFKSYPVFDEDTVYISTARSLAEWWGEQVHSSTLHALDLETGRSRWSRHLPGGLAAPTIADGRVFTVARSGQVAAFDTDDGRRLWTRLLPSPEGTRASPVAVGDALYIRGYEKLYALDVLTGAVIWSQDTLPGGVGSPAIDANNLYESLFIGPTYPKVLARDRGSGEIEWTYSPGPPSGNSEEGPTVVTDGNRVYARSTAEPANGVILSAGSGANVGTFVTDVIPVVAGDIALYMREGELTARNVVTGTTIWTFTGDGTLGATPIIVDSTVYVGSTSGQLYALDLEDGSVEWSDSSELRFTQAGEQSGFGAGSGVLVTPTYHGISAWSEGSGPTTIPGPDRFPGATSQVADLPPRSPSSGQTVSHGFDAAHSGFMNIDSLDPPLRQRWSREINAEDESFKREGTQPLIVDHKVILTRKLGDNAAVRAWDLETGEELWNHQEPGTELALTYDAGKVFIRTESGGRDGELVALNASDGTEAWRSVLEDTDGEASIQAYGGTVVVLLDDGFAGYRSDTGALMWSGVGNTWNAPLAMEGDAVYSAHDSGSWAFSRLTGDLIWTSGRSSDGSATGSHQMFGSGHLFDAHNETGRIRRGEDGAFVDGFYSETTPAVAGDIAVLTSDSDTFAQSISSGKTLWSTRLGDEDWEMHYAANSTPGIVGRTVYRPANNVLYANDLATGEAVWATKFGPPIEGGDSGDPSSGVSAGDGALAVVDGNKLIVFEEAGDDYASPETHLISGPPPETDTVNAVFEFEGTGEGFECMDDDHYWARCNNGTWVREDPGPGRYLFRVRAVNENGVVDPSPVTVEWLHHSPGDLTAPNVTFTSVPPPKTPSRRARLTFEADEPAEFTCRLNERKRFDCSSPTVLKRLRRGKHRFEVVAEDRAGLTSFPSAYEWKITRR